MRSFAGRDILSLKDFERQEFFRVFEIAEDLEPVARGTHGGRAQVGGSSESKSHAGR